MAVIDFCDDNDGNGIEDRFQNTTFALEDDFVRFGMFHDHEVYPEAIEYDLMKKSEKGDMRAIRH